MWARGVVIPPPGFDQDLGLPEIVEDFTRQQLVPELGVEALAVAVFPRRTRFDIERLHTDPAKPVAQGIGDKLRAVIGTDMLWRAMMDEQLAQRVEHVPRVELAFDTDGEALAGELIYHAQHAEDLSIMRAVLHEVIGPDMPLVRWP